MLNAHDVASFACYVICWVSIGTCQNASHTRTPYPVQVARFFSAFSWTCAAASRDKLNWCIFCAVHTNCAPTGADVDLLVEVSLATLTSEPCTLSRGWSRSLTISISYRSCIELSWLLHECLKLFDIVYTIYCRVFHCRLSGQFMSSASVENHANCRTANVVAYILVVAPVAQWSHRAWCPALLT